MPWLTILTLAAWGAAPETSPPAPGQTAATFVTGIRFSQQLDEPLSAAWTNLEGRYILSRLSRERNVSIVLDRRIDPTRALTIEFQNSPLRAALRQLAAARGGDLSTAGNTVYLGPPASAAPLRTLCVLRTEELAKISAGLGKTRRQTLLERQTFAWNDLDTPREILERLAAQYKLEMHGLDQIPHDLWAGATLPETTLVEALSLVLIQFDLTWAWADRGNRLEIMALPTVVALEKSYAPAKLKPAEALRQWSAEIPGLALRAEGGKVVARGTAEQIADLDELVETGKLRREKLPEPPVPLGRRQFTLRIQDIPARALLKKLEASGVVFQYDADTLKAASVDLERRIKMDVDKAPADEFFRQLCDQLGLTFQIDNLTVTLTPK
jgi:hypothetical protein